jgi:MoxR-like ATPase
VRGAIDLALVAEELGTLRGQGASDPGVTLDAALLALSGRIRVREGSSRSAEEVVRELWERFLGPPVAAADPGAPADAGSPGKA